MRILLFCENRYAIDILQPLYEEARRQQCHDCLWYIHTRKINKSDVPADVVWTDSIQKAYDFHPEAVFVPGNIVPYYLSGVKVQVFHGYAAEKKDHWVIRRYFDTYFTQGPYFTSHFQKLARRYGDFEVTETGWTKQDWVKQHLHDYDADKQRLLSAHGASKILLYAPTFSPKLTSLPYVQAELDKLLDVHTDLLLLMKFHPLTDERWVDSYRTWASGRERAVYVEKTENVTRCQMMADVMLSDTSSAVYEFLLLDRPVLTFRSIATDIYWENFTDPSALGQAFERAQTDPRALQLRQWIRDNYDPHTDGLCCARMLDAAEDFNRRHGVPERRHLNLWRKYTSIKTFGWPKR